MTSLAVHGVTKSFGPQAVLSGVDLAVAEGSLTTILGPSGSGKTTLLRIIAGFERADGGTVSLADQLVDDGRDRFVPSERRGIGYVPQEGALFPHLSVGKNVAFGLDRSVRRSGKVGHLLEMVGLAGMAKRYPHQLSGGQQQRVALARALAIEPGLVLLDEPFSSLDASLRSSVRGDVQEVLRQAGTTAILVTHDQDEALSISDHVAIIRDGCIGQIDSPQDLYAHPADPDLARFLGEGNLIEGEVRGPFVVTALGTLPITTGDGGQAPKLADKSRATVLIRPEQLRLVGGGGEGVQGHVLSYEYFGHDAVVRVAPRESALVQGRPLVVRITGGTVFEPGTAVGVEVSGPVLAWPIDRMETSENTLS